MGGGGMHVGEHMDQDHGQDLLLQVGSYTSIGGISKDGVFAGVFVHVMATDVMSSGRIASVSTVQGTVTGFQMNRRGQSVTVVLDPETVITRRGQPVSPAALAPTQVVRVEGLTRQDDSILASTVRIMGGRG
jgi:hypothetical protein